MIRDLEVCRSAIIENVFDDKHSERLQLDNVGSYIRGLTYSSNDVVEHGGTLVMRSNNIVNGSLLDYNNNVVFVNKQMSAEQQLQNGDIVICMANGSSSLVGKSSFYDGNWHSPITVGAFCGIYRSKEPIVKWLFQTNKYRRYICNSLQGGNGAIANLNGEDILNMSFSIPNAPIQFILFFICCHSYFKSLIVCYTSLYWYLLFFWVDVKRKQWCIIIIAIIESVEI